MNGDNVIQTIYRPVPGYTDLYAGMDGTIVHGERGVLKQKSPAGTGGYPHVHFPAPHGGTTTIKVYRLVAAAFLGPKEPGLCVRHTDGNKTNSTLGNLCYGTPKDNTRDSIAHGTHGSLTHKQKTQCAQGHEYTPENTYTPPGTDWRQCRICRAVNNLKNRPLRGRRRIPEAKRVIVEQLLHEHPSLSDREIARRAGVGHPTVARYRTEGGD